MHRTVLLLASALVYFSICIFGLAVFDAGIVATSLVLFGIPAYMLARYSAAPAAVLSSVAIFGIGLSVLLEGIAHTYGIWYVLGVEELKLFGLIPLEVIATSLLQILFLVLLYELLFDDGEYSEMDVSHRLISIGTFSVAVFLLVGLHRYILTAVFVSYSYTWIVGILIASSFSLLVMTGSMSVRFFDRLCAFSLYASFPLLCSLYIAIVNTHIVFAYTSDYLYTFQLWGTIVPIEAFLMLFALPLFVATCYELYLDDAH